MSQQNGKKTFTLLPEGHILCPLCLQRIPEIVARLFKSTRKKYCTECWVRITRAETLLQAANDLDHFRRVGYLKPNSPRQMTWAQIVLTQADMVRARVSAAPDKHVHFGHVE